MQQQQQQQQEKEEQEKEQQEKEKEQEQEEQERPSSVATSRRPGFNCHPSRRSVCIDQYTSRFSFNPRTLKPNK